MNIALLGYGRMGKAIEAIALNRGHHIVLKVSSHQDHIDFSNVDVAIDFSLPNSAVHNISMCLNANVPVISGTTGWLEHYDAIVDLCKQTNGTFLYASNFSLGVNIFFEINKSLAKLIGRFPGYTTSIKEIHHTQKLDAPSGTAITLAEGIIEETDYSEWTMDNPSYEAIQIIAERVENVPGTHEINYDSEIDSIEIKHTAHNRQGFALGAVIAAEYIKDKKGIFTMKDVLNIS
ncbi:4-hydroxy-tetrahydrodipicolinate reductase [Psychroserpens sp.]|uniref:4-hydroxy-tetrahydrodipicolinate reductase n=1 Tax=Psychroserpens sp. TaxID=2020870 RepID=UPI001B22EE51|nr:4-hydroxy-tetrahydrodipicolinate reductase [Psychroserpens sp.]MBO6606351.1 4-hydroxy-tetrahydrodipicolinate reductase [Psychroserpens sp.]MBO6631376.1 4-hydroxy-tetrahydrodipicolinate reductase [Psychroserpens sp.]MBO6653055.1 4-hydroxy-tetrahydrodipicolinate reductase [Psychroserpens sp.]MBO6680917.1 4-hydroxy-tetrahydrodipicolinate reductase [Psychroserpens sp.]MBO6750125.1 4-hydroxy-tetrahydrodipicolinate reductase [Psychroserpens sp.]